MKLETILRSHIKNVLSTLKFSDREISDLSDKFIDQAFNIGVAELIETKIALAERTKYSEELKSAVLKQDQKQYHELLGKLGDISEIELGICSSLNALLGEFIGFLQSQNLIDPAAVTTLKQKLETGELKPSFDNP